MKRLRTSLALMPVIGSLLLLLAACTDSSLSPVFYTLERERELFDDRGMGDDSNVFRVVAAGTRFFAAAGGAYWREDAAGERWQRIAPPAAIANALCNQIEYFAAAGHIVAWFYNADDPYDNGLYSLDPTGSPPAGWTAVTGPALVEPRVELLKEVNGQLSVAYNHFVDNPDPDPDTVHSLYSVNGAYSFSVASFPGPDTEIFERIIDVEYGDGAYWVATEPNALLEWLFTGALGSLGVDATAPSMSAARPAGALYPYNGNLYVSGQNGLIFYRPDITDTWTTPTGDPVKVDGLLVRFTRFSRAETGYLFVGTQGYGYYRFAESPATQPRFDLDRQPSYNISGLRGGAILSFLAVDDAGPDDPDTIFACTYGNGLWRADYDGLSIERWPWVQE